MDGTFLDERITKTQELIVVYEDAIAALGTGVQAYTLDTGQNRTTVSKLNLTELNRILNSLYNRCATLEARRSGAGTTNARPAW